MRNATELAATVCSSHPAQLLLCMCLLLHALLTGTGL
jgi:hypothetical protein